MESLSETKWDVVIAGTGLAQSLLALSLSHSGKKVLHLDRNQYYGAAQAAFSLQEVEKWQEQVNKDERSPFSDAQITVPAHSSPTPSNTQLGPSRSYTLTLSPQLLYAQSALLPVLVTSRVHEQLEFQAVGSWWLCKDESFRRPDASDSEQAGGSRQQWKGILQKIPSGREDVFSDNTISVRDKRALMKFLRHVLQEQENTETEDSLTREIGVNSLAYVLASHFNIPSALYQPLLALSLSQDTADSTNAQYAINRIRRHLRSIGMFGPGFGSMIIKYGGGAEIAQVGCRAGAVGGGVYVLGRGIDNIETLPATSVEAQSDGSSGNDLAIRLSDGERITSRYAVGDEVDLPTVPTEQPSNDSTTGSAQLVRSISVVSSPLPHLFPPTSENGPIPAGAVVVLGGVRPAEKRASDEHDNGHPEEPPIYLLVHSSDSGECPTGQCVVYASTEASAKNSKERLADAVEKLLSTANEEPAPCVLWSMSYVQRGRASSDTISKLFAQDKSGRVLTFPPASLDLAFDDALVDGVRAVWRKTMGAEADDADFLRFEERQNIGDSDD